MFGCEVAGVKVYMRQTWNFRSHAVSACSNHMFDHMHVVTVTAWTLISISSWIYLCSSYFGLDSFLIHRHLIKLNWLMTYTSWLVMNVSSVSGHSINIGSLSGHMCWQYKYWQFKWPYVLTWPACLLSPTASLKWIFVSKFALSNLLSLDIYG